MRADIPSLYLCLAAGFGLLIGSFLNVCIYRLPRDLSVVAPRSFCPACGQPISWFDNIPVLSYLLLRGRCRHCSKSIGLRYPVVELTTAVLFALVVWHYGITFVAVKWIVFEALLVALFWTDLEERILPDEFTLGGAILGLVFAAFIQAPGVFSELLLPHAKPLWQSLFESFLGAVLLTAPIWLLGLLWQRLRKREVLGLGDVKLLPLLGLFLGLENGIFALLIGSISGVLLGGGYILVTRKNPAEYELPLGTFFCFGAALVPLIVKL